MQINALSTYLNAYIIKQNTLGFTCSGGKVASTMYIAFSLDEVRVVVTLVSGSWGESKAMKRVCIKVCPSPYTCT